MVFNSFSSLFLAILFIWLSGVTVVLFRSVIRYNQLTRGITSQTLTQVISNFLAQEKLTGDELKRVREEFEKMRLQGKIYLQKIGLVRFNPFSDTGGDQSFSLALLDGQENGIIMTSLYARTGVRWYIKTIKKGKGLEHDLSKEEAEALKRATK